MARPLHYSCKGELVIIYVLMTLKLCVAHDGKETERREGRGGDGRGENGGGGSRDEEKYCANNQCHRTSCPHTLFIVFAMHGSA